MSFFVCYDFTEIDPLPEYYSVSPTSAGVETSGTYCYASTYNITGAANQTEADIEIADLNTQLATQRVDAVDMITEINATLEFPVPPSIPLLLVPLNGSSGIEISATTNFYWAPSTPITADYYDVQISTSGGSDFELGLLSTTITSGAPVILGGDDFDYSSIYYWRVRGSILNYLKGDWGSIFSLTTADQPVIPDGTQVYTEFENDRAIEAEKSTRKPSGIFRH